MNTERELPIIEEVGDELNRLFLAAEGSTPRWGRLRAGKWMRARVLLPLATLVIAGSAAAATVTLSGGSKPIHVGRYSACAPGATYLASTQTGLVYPVNYPSLAGTGLAKRGVARCFTSLQGAIRAGYTVASVPNGRTQISGIYFGRSSAFVRETCSRAQSVVKAPVFCPSVLPTPWDDQSTPGAISDAPDCPGKGCEHPILGINGAFSAPTWYRGSGDGIGSVSIWAISTQQESATATVGLVGCPGAKLDSRTRFRGHPAGWYTCVDTDIVQTSSLLQWTIGQEHYGLMLSGPAGLRRRLAEFIAAHLIEMKPRA